MFVDVQRRFSFVLDIVENVGAEFAKHGRVQNSMHFIERTITVRLKALLCSFEFVFTVPGTLAVPDHPIKCFLIISAN